MSQNLARVFGQKLAAPYDPATHGDPYQMLPTTQVAAPPRADGSEVTYQDLKPSQPSQQPVGFFRGLSQGFSRPDAFTSSRDSSPIYGTPPAAQQPIFGTPPAALRQKYPAIQPSGPTWGASLRQKYLPGVPAKPFAAAGKGIAEQYTNLRDFVTDPELRVRTMAALMAGGSKQQQIDAAMQIRPDIDVPAEIKARENSTPYAFGREYGRVTGDLSRPGETVLGAVGKVVNRGLDSLSKQREEAAAAAGQASPPTDIMGALRQAYNKDPLWVGGAGAGIGALGLYGAYNMMRKRRQQQNKQFSRARYPQIIN